MMHMDSKPFLLFPFETMWKRARVGHLRIGDQSNDFDAGGKAKSSLAAHANLGGCPPFAALARLTDLYPGLMSRDQSKVGSIPLIGKLSTKSK